MAYCFYNGVKLPELPSGVIANYPYCWIRKNDNTQYYDLLFTRILGYYNASLGGIEYGTTSGTTDIVHYRIPYSSASVADGWDSYQTTNTWMALDANRTVMWSNHYIPNGSLTATVMYFDAHEAIPEVDAYQIEKETVVGIADQVRRLCKTENTMTPAQIESNLGGLNIELEELHVAATTEEQTFTPSEGIYGFSKVVVDAVEEDIGGSGVSDLPDAESTTFGSEFSTGSVATGKYIVGDYKISGLPSGQSSTHPYCLIQYSGVSLNLYYSTKPIQRSKAGNYDGSFETDGKTGSATYYTARVTWSSELEEYLVGEWEGPKSSGTWLNTNGGMRILWANHNLVHPETGAVTFAGGALVPEVEEGTIVTAVPCEALYQITGESLTAIATAIQRLTGNTDLLTPADMESSIINIIGTV